MDRPPAAVLELARRRGLGQLVVICREDDAGALVSAAIISTAAAVVLVAGSGATPASLIAAAVLMPVSVSSATIAAARRLAPDRSPALYCFRHGVVRRDRGGPLHAYPWQRVTMRFQGALPLPPWGSARTFVHLRGDDGRRLGTVGDDGQTRTIVELAETPG